jgi:hypothetical protein
MAMSGEGMDRRVVYVITSGDFEDGQIPASLREGDDAHIGKVMPREFQHAELGAPFREGEEGFISDLLAIRQIEHHRVFPDIVKRGIRELVAIRQNDVHEVRAGELELLEGDVGDLDAPVEIYGHEARAFSGNFLDRGVSDARAAFEDEVF